MDDIAGLISSLSSDDIDMLKGIADSILGGGESESEESPKLAPKEEQSKPSFDLSMLSNLGNLGGLAGLGGSGDSGGLNIGPTEIGMIMKIKSAFEKLNNNNTTNNNTQLIEALKPHLSTARRSRADEALQMMRMMDMLPLLKDLF